MVGRVDNIECRRLRGEGWTLSSLASRYGVSKVQISRVCAGVICPIRHIGGGRDFQKARARKNEIAVSQAFEKGMGPKQIAHDLGLALNTVYKYLPSLQSPAMLRIMRARAVKAQPCV